MERQALFSVLIVREEPSSSFIMEMKGGSRWFLG